MKRWMLVVAIALLALSGAWILQGPAEVAPTDARAIASEMEPRGPTAQRGAVPGPLAAARGPWTDAKRKVSAQERAAVREQIVQALQRRRATAAAEPAPEPQAAESEGGGIPGEGIEDRTGGELGAMVVTVNQDFLPLANECYQQALEGDPTVRGMLDLDVQIIADEEIGGLVDSVELGAENEITDAGMTECIRESMLSTVFPSPDGSGSQGVRLTLRFEPEP